MTKAIKKLEQAMLHGDLRLYIPKFTYRAFAITITGFAAVFLLFSLLIKNGKNVEPGIISHGTLPPPTIINLKPEPNKPNIPVIPNKPLTPDLTNITGTSQVSGTFIPSKDVPVTNIDRIAPIDRAGLTLSTYNPNGPQIINAGRNALSDEIKTPTQVTNTPDNTSNFLKEWEVEKSPVLDYAHLKRFMTYPELARKIGKEGKVLVGVLVSETGKVLSAEIEYSDSELFNNTALEAIRKYGIFTPAIQGGSPVPCKVTIPIEFKLH